MNRFKNDLMKSVESDAGKLIVWYILNVGTATVDELATKFDWTISKTYSVCSKLEDKDVLTELKHSTERYALTRVSL